MSVSAARVATAMARRRNCSSRSARASWRPTPGALLMATPLSLTWPACPRPSRSETLVTSPDAPVRTSARLPSARRQASQSLRREVWERAASPQVVGECFRHLAPPDRAIAMATKEASPAGRRERRCRLEAQNRWSAVLAAEPVTGERRAALKKKEGSAMRLGADAQDDTQPCDLMSR